MNAKILSLAVEVAKGGLSFVADKTALKGILKDLDAECGDIPAPRKVPYMIGALKALDARYGWATQFVRPGETNEQRQAREDSMYDALVAMYFLDQSGVRVGVLAGR